VSGKSGLSNQSEILQRLISCQTVKTTESKKKKVSFGGVINIA
jgi:hypothetical protein